MSGAGEEEEGRLALASWLAGQSESQLIQTRLDCGVSVTAGPHHHHHHHHPIINHLPLHSLAISSATTTKEQKIIFNRKNVKYEAQL